jgi:acetyltransferase-like isoleucine patch superfamily enzyme
LKIVAIVYKVLKKVCLEVNNKLSLMLTYLKFFLNDISIPVGLKANGIPMLNKNLKGNVSIGRNFTINSGRYNNVIGRQQPTYLIVGKEARLEIGNNVGISATAIYCHQQITVGDNVKIGGGCVIYDTDFHSLQSEHRNSLPENMDSVKKPPIVISDNAFIGAHSIILKGITIGINSIIGAGSVVSRSVPDNDIWAGNPDVFMRKIV